MRYKKNISFSIYLILLIVSTNLYSMGLRSFVALPIEKNGTIVRLTYAHTKYANTNTLNANVAYGISSYQTLFAGSDRQGDISVLYRHIVWQKDTFSGTKRLGLLGGAVFPTDEKRDGAFQAGFVYTYFKNKNELDINMLYQKGLQKRLNSGRYDISWQHRLFPAKRPLWGLSQEINSVLEFNGRYKQGNKITHQVTLGIQSIHKIWVLEGGIVKDMNNKKELQYILSVRIHF